MNDIEKINCPQVPFLALQRHCCVFVFFIEGTFYVKAFSKSWFRETFGIHNN